MNGERRLRCAVLDLCFRDESKIFFMNDLIEAVNKMLKSKDMTPVSKRTIQNDIAYMKKPQGGGILLREDMHGGVSGREVIYRYVDTSFSIQKKVKVLSGKATKQLRNTIEMLWQFKGLPNYKDLEQVLVWLKVRFNMDGMSEGAVKFAQNPYLKGLDLFGDLLDMVMGKWKIDIMYAPFGRKKRKRTVHPYQLRQWNYRWFLIAREEEKLPRLPYVVIPLDRIEDIIRIYPEGFIPKGDDDFDFDEYFENIVGVSMQTWSKEEGYPHPVPLVAKVYYPNASYIFTKPIHWSQTVLFDSLHPKEEKKEEEEEDSKEGEKKEKKSKEEIEWEKKVESMVKWAEQHGKAEDKPYMVFLWNVIPNEELVQALLVYADQMIIKEPEWVRLKLIDRAKAILAKNGVR